MTSITWVNLTVYMTDSENRILSVDNVRLDCLELTDQYLKFRDLDDVWYTIPMDTLLYYTYKIIKD